MGEPQTAIKHNGGEGPYRRKAGTPKTPRVVGDGMNTFDHDCSENHEQLWKITKNDKNIDIFDYDCSENHEIMVVLMDLEAETLSESRSIYARPAQISFKSWFY